MARYAVVRHDDGSTESIPDIQYDEATQELIGWLETETLEAPLPP